MLKAYALVLTAVVFSGCSPSDPPAEAGVPAGTTKAAPAALGAPAQAGAGSVSGTVLETMDSGGYTYVKLDTDKGPQWAAVPQAAVKKGETVTVANAMPMEGFESKTLGRRFDRILFGTLGSGGGAAGLPAGHPPMGAEPSMAEQHASAAAGPDDKTPIVVDKAPGPEGRRVAEVHAQRGALADKPVAVRGKVVKFLEGIMGKNWVHLRDGSGSREAKDDDLTLTTAETVKVGDVVVARGTVRKDRDFGSGYSYPVIVEDVTFQKK